MSAAMSAVDHWIEEYRRREPELPGARLAWMGRLRAQALDRFAELGLPAARSEAWKYTDVKPLAKHSFHIPRALRLESDAIAPFVLGGAGAHCLVFVDGRFAPELSEPRALPPGVTVTSLARAVEQDPDVLQAHLGRCADDGAHGFAALNTAFMGDGAFIRLARGAVVETPIQLLFVASGAANSAAFVRNLVVAERDSHALIVESYASASEARYFTSAVTEVVVGANASVEHYKLVRESEQAYHVGAIHVHQERDSRYTSHNVASGGRLVRNDVAAVLNAEGVECTLNGLYLTRGRQRVDNFTRIDHRNPRSISREWYKGVLDGRSRGAFTGRVVVHPGAQHSDAQQANNNLLLSEGAEADSRPQLEIHADDVKCSHGTTVGQLDPDELFYLRSRGVDYELARSLLVYAFAGDIIERMRLAPVRAQLEGELTGRLLHGRSPRELA
ncbi:MAG: Fe-S cluster assembly protein SufD [Gammaproteobacteria bacterium]|nr:Fe-S cluster assembly protein SufD [Gammaproteobacteria bacterium]NIR96802.1 Fe-S cluster assembly protein SufD [Gammaproteobacteria bacterium]NIT62502.1 Fe-S cluster assembly protein SufD [Gammaproteobacteria bacterium]NIV19442.1 Fe-S cluster assembly protein SufD [Gammaproteobacteria bacterium]NIX10525.1 Fe-S cluster assembly protein SufD [Gammaproteobacteria bacterium]